MKKNSANITMTCLIILFSFSLSFGQEKKSASNTGNPAQQVNKENVQNIQTATTVVAPKAGLVVKQDQNENIETAKVAAQQKMKTNDANVNQQSVIFSEEKKK